MHSDKKTYLYKVRKTEKNFNTFQRGRVHTYLFDHILQLSSLISFGLSHLVQTCAGLFDMVCPISVTVYDSKEMYYVRVTAIGKLILCKKNKETTRVFKQVKRASTQSFLLSY